jgi:putative phage-type endonuclease
VSAISTTQPADAERLAAHWDCLLDRYSSEAHWLEARRSLIGASDSAGIFGVGYFDQSAVTVWDSKINAPRAIDQAKVRRLKVGKLMEPALRAIFAEESGQICVSPGDFTIFRRAEIPWLGATLDGLTEHDEYGPCPVELKNVSNFARDEWDGDEPPLKFAVQVQHQLAVTGASHGFLLGLIGGNEPVIKTIERNDRFIDAMLKRLEEFWGYVERRELPPVDSSVATAQILAKLWPEDSGATVALPPEAADWDHELSEAKEAIKAAEARKLAAENKLKAAIGEATFGEFGGIRYSWKSQTRAEHVVKESTFRVLRRCK